MVPLMGRVYLSGVEGTFGQSHVHNAIYSSSVRPIQRWFLCRGTNWWLSCMEWSVVIFRPLVNYPWFKHIHSSHSIWCTRMQHPILTDHHILHPFSLYITQLNCYGGCYIKCHNLTPCSRYSSYHRVTPLLSLAFLASFWRFHQILSVKQDLEATYPDNTYWESNNQE